MSNALPPELAHTLRCIMAAIRLTEVDKYFLILGFCALFGGIEQTIFPKSLLVSALYSLHEKQAT